MNNWRMVLANLGQVVIKGSVERIEWYKKSKEVKLSKEIMIRKYQKPCIYATYKRTFLKQLLKKTLELTKENPYMEENLCW